MDAYFDSAIIVKWYVRKATSPDAIRLAGAYVAPYCLTQWQALEVKNAIRVKAFRKEITAAEMNQSIAAFEQDIATGRWQRPAYPTAAVEQEADERSASYSATLGCRTGHHPRCRRRRHRGQGVCHVRWATRSDGETSRSEG